MSASADPKLALRPFLPADASTVADIFRESIAELTADDYSEAQQEAWASAADDEAQFAQKLGKQLTLVATLQGSPIGFASLASNDRVDMLYVHPAAAGQGAGAQVVDHGQVHDEPCGVVGGHGIPVARGDGDAGHVERRGDVLGQDGTHRVVEHHVERRHRGHHGQHGRQVVLHRSHEPSSCHPPPATSAYPGPRAPDRPLAGSVS